MRKTGLAFSGGGIRSAALCSGVLRRLLHRKIVPDYLSCVSGGGYTGAAYLDWKYRNEQKDDPRWHKEFFDHMRKRAGFVCDWLNPLQGIIDTISLFTIVFFLSIILPFVNWCAFAFPTAYIIDYFFGDLLRDPFTCPDEKTHNFTSSQIAQNPEVSNLFNMTKEIECVPKLGPEMYFTFMTFAILFILFLLLYFIKRVAGPSLKPIAKILFNLAGFTFAMVFLPWLIEEYIAVTRLWVNALILVLSIFLWLGIPPLRDKASLAIIIYVYAYAVKWRVYKTKVLFVEYNEFRFALLLWISGILIWMRPVFSLLQLNLLHAYNRWRLQKAFYSPESTGATSCLEITCQSAFPQCICCRQTAENLHRPLTLEDLAGLSPEYICNVTVNKWRTQHSQRKPTFDLLAMTPTIIETISNKSGQKQFEKRLHPGDIELSEAMATSAAALSYHMGRYESSVEAIGGLQIILGLGFGKSIVAEPKRWTGCCFKVIAAFIQLVLALPVMVLPMIPYLGGSEDWNRIAVISFLVLSFLLMFIAVMPTRTENPGCWEKFVR